eukprot:m.215105 g.215105  ORF g.215105 m.215105 type:complete len:580 (+) comp15875_c0_seq4:148-1887(+)
MKELSDYTVLQNVGKGSYGEVSLVRCRADKKKYVLKRIEMRSSSEREQAMALQEASLMSSLHHPNVVTYRESFVASGNLYICMGFCEGGDLHQRIELQKVSAKVYLKESQIMEWTIQIALGLQYLHEQNILHRDLKTQNIFLTKKKIIKVGDLGIARVLDSKEAMATTVIGTPYYMSPELFSNVPYNHKSDVWSFGCCVYEMASLRQAFNAKDLNSLRCKVILGKPSTIPDIYSMELNTLVMNMLSHDPDDRPSVSKILKKDFVRTHMERFLGEAKQSRVHRRSKREPLVKGDTVANGDKRISPQPPPVERDERPMSDGENGKVEDKDSQLQTCSISQSNNKSHDSDATKPPVVKSTNPNRRARQRWRENKRSPNPQHGFSDTISNSTPAVSPMHLPGLTTPIDDVGEFDLSLSSEGEDDGNDIMEDDGEGDFGQYIGILGSTFSAPDTIGEWGSYKQEKNVSESSEQGMVTPARHAPAPSIENYTPMRGPLIERSRALRRQCRQHLSEENLNHALMILSENTEDESARDKKLLEYLGQERYSVVQTLLVETAACELAITHLNEISTKNNPSISNLLLH